MTRFNYRAPAELFTGRSMRGSRTMRYHRFDTGAEALRFAMETLPREHLLAAVLKVDETRYRHGDIQRFYAAKEYPLARPAAEGEAPPAARRSRQRKPDAKPVAKNGAKTGTKRASGASAAHAHAR